MREFSDVIQIRKIRSKGKIGGVIFSAITLGIKPARYVIKADWERAPAPAIFQEAHIWHVSGEVTHQTVQWNDGTVAQEKVIIPKQMTFVKAANENLMKLLAESKDFGGISKVKAEKLVSFFGDELYEIATRKDVKRLLPIIGLEVANRLIKGLNNYQEINTLRLLDDLGIPNTIGESILKIWGDDAYDKIKENPYILITFMGDMKTIDEYAISRLGLATDSPLRLIAYVKDVMFKAFKAGNTCLPTNEVKYRTKRLLGKELSEEAFKLALNSGEIVVDNNITQVRSMDIIESTIASFITELNSSFYSDSLCEKIRHNIKLFESGAKFSLNEEQRNAVIQCCSARMSLLTGGAGCGKTTVIETICFVLEHLKLTSQIYLMALAGKAAQRITEATGRGAMTIASFIYTIKLEDISEDAVIIVDEASMVDTLSLLKILKRIPKNGRLILTGDEQQLPPVGLGLTLHELVHAPLCNSKLTQGKRQDETTGIPLIANQVRNYHQHQTDINFRKFEGIADGVSFVECIDNNLENQVVSIYDELGGNGGENDIMILSATKHLNGGVTPLNAAVHDKYAKGNVVNFSHTDFGNITHHINGRSLRIGELVMYTRNDYIKNIRNGSVGKVIEKNDNGIKVNFEGNRVNISISELKFLEHAYALTVHKSQGSQFERVIIVLRACRNLDRHLIYTALTRAQKQVVFVGDMQAFYQALNISKALSRHTMLTSHLATLGHPLRVRSGLLHTI